MSNTINNGGRVFPADTSVLLESERSISLRDYFAAKALQGLLSHTSNGNASDKSIAEWAYSQADAMLRARGEA